MCNSKKLELFLDLGDIPKVDRYLTSEELNKTEPFYPLTVYLCKDCGLAQLGFIVPASELYDENYAYESSTTKNRRENHNQLAEYICNTFKIKNNSLIVDIGSNVGILLEYFKDLGMKVLGVDASANIVEKANRKGIQTILAFALNLGLRRITAEFEEGNTAMEKVLIKLGFQKESTPIASRIKNGQPINTVKYFLLIGPA